MRLAMGAKATTQEASQDPIQTLKMGFKTIKRSALTGASTFFVDLSLRLVRLIAHLV